MKYKLFIIGGVVLGLVVLAGVAKANPSYFADGVSTAAATSTVTYMTPGTATTTTFVYDAYADGNNEKADAATLGIQFTGSSTASSIKIDFEYAFNNSLANCQTTPTACDWYKDSLLGTNAVVGTTTNGTLGIVPNSYQLSFSSSTINGAAGSSTIATRLITLPTVARYIRAVISMPIGSLNGAVWATIRPSRQNP